MRHHRTLINESSTKQIIRIRMKLLNYFTSVLMGIESSLRLLSIIEEILLQIYGRWTTAAQFSGSIGYSEEGLILRMLRIQIIAQHCLVSDTLLFYFYIFKGRILNTSN